MSQRTRLAHPTFHSYQALYNTHIASGTETFIIVGLVRFFFDILKMKDGEIVGGVSESEYIESRVGNIRAN